MSPPTSTRSTLAEALAGWPPPVLDPAGPFAGSIAGLSWVLFAMAVLVLGVVLAALGVALFGSAKLRRRLGGDRLIWAGGLAFPVLVLSSLLVYGLSLTGDLAAEPRRGDLRVRVVGEMWWWRVTYLDEAGRAVFHDANEIHIPAGRPVLFDLEAADVIHSFWVPRLAGKVDMVPGRRNLLRLTADRPGVYAGQCAEYCGGPHALMGLVVVVHEPAAYRRWRAGLAAPRPPAADPAVLRGADVFARSGCGACHRIQGTAANGLAGPDLTRVGARRSLGAGILPNNRGALAGWVANSQAIKPGNRMPDYAVLSGPDLLALSAYLESLK